MKYVTIKDIARHLSVSVSTVSRALADDKNVRKETREKVWEAAKELGYRRNPVAMNLKYGHTNTVGVIVPEMITPFASQVIRGIQNVLNHKNIKVIIADSESDPAKERDNLHLMEGFMVDGIIICLCSYKKNQDEFMRLQRAGLPMVFYDRIPHGIDASQVVVDDYAKSFFLVERLIRSGRRRIVHLQGPADIYNSVERARGYKDALKKYGIDYDPALVLTGSTIDFEDGEKAANILMEKGIDFDAIFAFTETLAIGSMARLKDLGKRIPEDVAVANFSGTVLGTVVNPKLTSVEQPLYEMGVSAANEILQKIKNPESPNHTIVLDANIKMRKSM